ncbi:hypothetical protein BDV19DRAFT_392041 [Aspergillus venezuelensis]
MASNTNSNPSLSGAGTSNPQGPSKSNPASASISALASSQSQAQQPLYPGLGANFAHNPQGLGPYTVSYDQEAYSQYMADEEAAALAAEAATETGTGSTGSETKKTKTPKQIYREQWVRRALNPAISDPRGDPSPIDFECAENQRVMERI